MKRDLFSGILGLMLLVVIVPVSSMVATAWDLQSYDLRVIVGALTLHDWAFCWMDSIVSLIVSVFLYCFSIFLMADYEAYNPVTGQKTVFTVVTLVGCVISTFGLIISSVLFIFNLIS